MLNTAQLREIDTLRHEIAADYVGVFSDETVGLALNDSVDLLLQSLALHDYLPIFAAKFTRERLDAIAHTEGTVVIDHPQVLFICQHNTGASLIAATVFNSLCGDRARARSAGITPSDALLPIISDTLHEHGFEMEHHFPRPLTDEILASSDVVVTLGVASACPVLPGRQYLDWDEPADIHANPGEMAAMRDDIEAHVRALLNQLIPG